MINPLPKNFRNFWAVNILGWSIYFVTLLIEHLLSRHELNAYVVLWQLLITCTGFSLSLMMRRVYLRFQLDKHSLPKLLGIIFLTTTAMVNIWYFLDIGLDFIMKRDEYVVYDYIFKNYIHLTFFWAMILTGWSVLYFVIKLWIEWQDESTRSKNAIHLARHSQLQMLRYQLNPHFLFNSLNSIRALIDENESDAQDMITELSEFLRYSLNTPNTLGIPLHHEIEAIRHYFSIEKKRFENKLDIAFDISKEAENWPVIGFLLHPLVENAVKYGMQTSDMPLTIRIKAWTNENCLFVSVGNSGQWINPEATDTCRESTHTGLENMRNRLENVFPGKHEVKISSEGNWISVLIQICNDSERDWKSLYE